MRRCSNLVKKCITLSLQTWAQVLLFLHIYYKISSLTQKWILYQCVKSDTVETMYTTESLISNFLNSELCTDYASAKFADLTFFADFICIFKQCTCSNGITNSFRTLPLLSRNKSQTCARSQVLRKKIQHAMHTTD